MQVRALQIPMREALRCFIHQAADSLERVADHFGHRRARPAIVPETPTREAFRLVPKVRRVEPPLEVRD